MSKILNLIFKATDQATPTVDKVSGGVDGLAEGLKGLIGPAALATAGLVALKKVYEFGEEGAALKRLEDAGTRLAAVTGDNYRHIVRAIEEASGRTVGELEAMTQANTAMRLGVAQTPEEFEKLTTAAIALGRATGRTATESVADLTTGIGRMSKLVLDNLGIVYDADTVFGEYAETIGKTAAALTDAEKKQALVNLALEAAKPLLDEHGNLIDDAASSYERLGVEGTTAWNRIKKSADDAIGSSLDAVADYMEAVNRAADAEEYFASIGMNVEMMIARHQLGYIELSGVTGDYKTDVINLAEAWERGLSRADEMMAKQGGINKLLEESAGVIDNLATKEAWLQAARLAIAGDFRGSQAIIDAIRLREEEAASIQAVIDTLMALDGRVVSYDIVGTVHAGTGGPSMSDQGLSPPSLSTRSTGGWGAWQLDALGRRYRHNPSTGEYERGYQTGGSFDVGGAGGRDSQPVRFMADPGEHVNISKEDSIQSLALELRRMVNQLPVMMRDAMERAQ